MPDTRTLIVALSVALGAASARTHETSATATGRLRTTVDALAVRRSDGSVARIHDLASRLDARWTSTRVDGLVAAGWTFDPSLPPAPSSALLAERQMEPELFTAWVRFRPLDGLRLTVGRADVASTVGWARLDGAQVAFQTGRGPAAAIALGVRPRPDVRRIDGWALDDGATPDALAPRGAPTRLVDMTAGWHAAAASVDIAIRDERTTDGLVAEPLRLGVAGRARARGAVQADGALVAAPRDGVERYEGRVVAPLRADRVSLDARARGRVQSFPSDSIFSVFPRSSHHTQSLGVVTLRRAGFVRAAALHRRDATGPGGSLVGVEAALSTRPQPGALEIAARADVAIDLHRSIADVRGDAALTWFVRRSVRLTAAPAAVIAPASGPAAFLRAGVTGVVDRVLELSLESTTGWDVRSGVSVRVFALADLRFEGT